MTPTSNVFLQICGGKAEDFSKERYSTFLARVITQTTLLVLLISGLIVGIMAHLNEPYHALVYIGNSVAGCAFVALVLSRLAGKCIYRYHIKNI